MDYAKKFMVKPGGKVRLSKIDPSFTGKHESREEAAPSIAKHLQRMEKLQYLLYADGNKSLLVVLQALDAAGKDGVVRHVFSGMNPQGTAVFGFKQPSKEELAHDFLWRVHLRPRPRARSSSSTARTTKTSWWCACTSSCPNRCGPSATTSSTTSRGS
jgi:polyphosphate kinase 2 (PPK2 family)